MRTTLLKTVVFCFGVMVAGTALAEGLGSANRSAPDGETRGSTDRWDYSGYVYGPKTVQDDTSLRSSAAMRGTTGQNQSRNSSCDLTTELNTVGGGCVPLGPD
jgi:hypothetical protein